MPDSPPGAQEPDPPARRPPHATEASAERMRRRAMGVDEAIRAAEADGAFDNLPGHGKPLTWRNDEAAGDMRLAFHLLANAGFSPEWIERGKLLRGRVEAIESRVEAFDAWCISERAELERARRTNEASRATLRATAAHQADRIRTEISALNDQIDKYNLVVPVATARIVRVALQERISRALDRLDSDGGAAG